MDHAPISLEPLADYLQPQFGNIYDYNFKVEGQFDVQEWTDELKQAIKNYLMHKAHEDLRNHVVDKLAHPARDTESHGQQVASIIAHYQPWEIAHAFHEAAVIAVPTLHTLIGHLDHWPYEDERWDVITWLDARATNDQLERVSIASGHPRLLSRRHSYNLADKLVQVLEPPALLTVWNYAVGPAPSDLTDTEWGPLDAIAAEASKIRVTRRPILGGLINEYERAA